MKLYVIRHGQTNCNRENKYNGKLDEDINEVGIKQAKLVQEDVKKLNVDLIICSPLLRTRHTCNIVNVNNIPIIYDKRIEERDCGDLSGLPIEVTDREEYWNYFTKIQYGTSENIQIFFKRVYDFLDELKLKDYENVLIVAHSGVSKAFSGYFEGINDGHFLNRGLKNCEIKMYEL